MLAGEKSNRNTGGAASVDLFTRALEQIQSLGKAADPRLMLRIKQGRAGPLHAMGRIEDSLLDYEGAITLARQLADPHTALACITGVPLLIYNTTLKDKVPHFCEQGLQLARELDNALASMGEAIQILKDVGNPRPIWQARESLASVYEKMRRGSEARDQWGAAAG